MHSEHNLDKTSPLRFIQIWISPRRGGLNPNYGSAVGDYNARENKWAHLVSDSASKVTTPIKINQDANIHVTEVTPGNTATFELQQGRQGYLLCMEGTAVVSGGHGSETLERHDAAEVFGSNSVTVTPHPDSNAPIHMLLVEMDYTGRGRGDL
jgi:redox-sensitive bicupin YhaK (pirin superfamily)